MKATSKTWTRTLDPDPKKPGPWKTCTLKKPVLWKTWTLKNMHPNWTLKNIDAEKHRINMGLKNMSYFRSYVL